MIAHWTANGEPMSALVIAHTELFEQLIDSHPQMEFVSWSTKA